MDRGLLSIHSMDPFGYVNGLERSLSFHRARNTVLAGNVANVDTPGYRSFDLKREVQLRNDAADLLSLGRTNRAHLTVGGLAEPYTVTPSESEQGAGSADGNGVSLEQELSKLNANRVRYATVSELVSRRLALLSYAASDGIG